MKKKTFFVNLETESSDSISFKIQLMVDELTTRSVKHKTPNELIKNKAIGKPTKVDLTKEDVEAKIVNWSRNPNLKIYKCLQIMNKYRWTLPISQWKKIMQETLLIKNPSLYLVSLTKHPTKRTWINSKGERKEASDYGDILTTDKNHVKLNKKYSKLIMRCW